MTFNYLGFEIISKRTIHRFNKTSSKGQRSNRVPERNNIYKTAVRQILIYATETRAGTKKTIQKIRIMEIRAITRITLSERRINKIIREECKIQKVD